MLITTSLRWGLLWLTERSGNPWAVLWEYCYHCSQLPCWASTACQASSALVTGDQALLYTGSPMISPWSPSLSYITIISAPVCSSLDSPAPVWRDHVRACAQSPVSALSHTPDSHNNNVLYEEGFTLLLSLLSSLIMTPRSSSSSSLIIVWFIIPRLLLTSMKKMIIMHTKLF